MPPPRRGVVRVSPTQMGGGIAQQLQRQRFNVEEAEDNTFDFISSSTSLVYVDDLHQLNELTFRRALSERIISCLSKTNSTGQYMGLLLLTKSPDPRQDVLTWLNLHCSMELQCSVMICWSEEECANYLGGLAEGGIVPLNYRMPTRKEDTPVPVLIEAFTQTPQLMTRLDVVRASNRLGTPAKLLTATTADFASLPGFGQKKAARLHAVLHAGFHTSRQLISDVLPNSDDRHDVCDAGETLRQSAKEKMMDELMKMRAREMDDSMDGVD